MIQTGSFTLRDWQLLLEMKEQPTSDEKPMGQVIQIDEARARDYLHETDGGTVEETLNAILDATADRRRGAGRYEPSQAQQVIE